MKFRPYTLGMVSFRKAKRNRLRLGMVCLLSFVLHAWPLRAQTASPEDKGRAILEAAVEALGGADFLNARDFRAEGRAFQFGREERLSGLARFVHYEKIPDKVRQELGKKKGLIVVFNGDKGWDKTFRGVREHSEEEMQRRQQRRLLSVEYILRFRLNEPGLLVRYVGADLIARRPVDLVEVVDGENRAVTIAIERASKLPVRRQWSRRNPRTRVRENEVVVLGKYRNVDGILTPYYTLRERNGQKIFELFLTGVAYNLDPPDSLFQRPPGPERRDPRRRRR